MAMAEMRLVPVAEMRLVQVAMAEMRLALGLGMGLIPTEEYTILVANSTKTNFESDISKVQQLLSIVKKQLLFIGPPNVAAIPQ